MALRLPRAAAEEAQGSNRSGLKFSLRLILGPGEHNAHRRTAGEDAAFRCITLA